LKWIIKIEQRRIIKYITTFYLLLPLHSYSEHLILLLTLAFFRRRKETISTEEEEPNPDIPKQRELV
jgi:hypothetical protein